MRPINTITIIRLVGCAALGLPGAVLAQNAGSNLEEIIVTATRIEQPLARVAAAISVVGQDDIQLGRQQLALDESLSRVPGLFMLNRYNFAQDLRIAIRGFGARANFGIRGVKILVDGIPETLPDGQGSVDGIDIGATGQIEVLRGPSSSLYGNASGGVISVVSERPPENPTTEIRLAAGDYGYRKFQAKIGGQGERLDYVVSVSDSTLDGYRTQSLAENTQLTTRLDLDLGNDRQLLTVFNYTDQPRSDDAGGVNLAEIAANVRAARDVNVQFDAGEFLEQSRLGFVYSMPLGERHSITARNYYVWRDFGNKLPFLAGGQVELDRFFAGGGLTYNFSSEIGGRSNELIVGFDFDRQDDDRVRFNNVNGAKGPLTFEQNETVTSRGIYIQDLLSLSETIDLTFGVRLDDVEFDVTDGFLSDGNDSGVRKLDDVSPMVAVSFALSETLNLYATYSSAFETPTTTEFANPSGAGGFNQGLEPQTARNLEVGLRGTINDRHRYDAAVFDIEVDDELIPFSLAQFPGRDFFENAGESSRTGIEFSIVSQLTDRLRSTLSYTHSDFEFVRFQTFAGNEIPGIADSLLFGELAYMAPSGWFAALDVLRVGEQFANNANTVVVDSYTVANLRIGAELDLGSMLLSPFFGINNLTDTGYDSNIRINAFGGRFYEPAPDRNFFAGVTLTFGR